ncbi:DUF4906 domain-containing protein [Parabacteroides sp. 52]|uniref:DUF4906 domain-containing protein n=1 Tax=unclassified Parabacteroides TaxID=2649774 RepID=UPI0013D28B28|nr:MULTISPECIES: DUF4906 domain-containing protein [unclassified Parabacteroides]MDH6534890.1 hypothetical protein [Parabacteroides sp. PM5-20]NDV55607.1 DUF4906 domain-containing protein [Parabacteroides sp. 52]
MRIKYRNNRFVCSLGLMISVLFFSCSTEDLMDQKERENETVEVEFRLGVEENNQVIGRSMNQTETKNDLQLRFSTGNPVDTRAADREDHIENVWILQFENTENPTDKLLAKVYVENLTQTTINGKTIYQLKANLEKKENCRLFFIANESAAAFSSLTVGSSTFSAFQTLTRVFSTNPVIGPATETFPMTAYYKGAIPILDPNVTLWMYRVAAKLSLTVLFDELQESSSLFLNFAQLQSVPQTVQYYDEGRYTDEPWIFPIVTSSFVNYPAQEFNIVSGTVLTWYMPENRRGINPLITNQKDKYDETDPSGPGSTSYATRIVLKGIYILSGKVHDITITLYPGENITSDFNIIRHTHYIMTADIRTISDEDNRIVYKRVNQ